MRAELRTANLKMAQKKADFDRVASVEAKLELTRHKDRTEQAFRKKLEQERLKMNKSKLQEIDEIMQENFTLKKELTELQKAGQTIFKP